MITNIISRAKAGVSGSVVKTATTEMTKLILYGCSTMYRDFGNQIYYALRSTRISYIIINFLYRILTIF